MDAVSISFDDEHRLRVLDAEQFKKTEVLEAECAGFVGQIQSFSDSVHSLVGVLAKQAEAIEKAKLKAIGQRNLVEHECENRRRRMAEYRAMIAEKQAELERYRVELASLEQLAAKQSELIGRLSNSEA